LIRTEICVSYQFQLSLYDNEDAVIEGKVLFT